MSSDVATQSETPVPSHGESPAVAKQDDDTQTAAAGELRQRIRALREQVEAMERELADITGVYHVKLI